MVIQSVMWLYKAYELTMQRDNLLDFDDQKLRAYIAISENHDLLGLLQNKFTEIIVDEFQDINNLDFAFIHKIASNAILVVTGDDDQAIYGFRGCTPDFIIDLEKYLNRPITSYELVFNYRCPANIVYHANKLIQHNRRRIPKSPIPNNKNSSNIKVISSISAGLESKLILSNIRRIKESKPRLEWHDLAVLYRTNAQSLPLQIEFIMNDVPFFVREEDNILQNKSLQRLLSVLRVKIDANAGRSVNPKDASE